MIELLHIDCMEYMKTLPDKAFELAIVDPPYGIGDFTRKTNRGSIIKRNYKQAHWNDEIPNVNYFSELSRVSKNQIIWGANYYNCFSNGGSIVWDKNNNHPDMSRCEIASNTLGRTVDYIYLPHFGFTDKDRVHPCQKPVALYKWLLKNYAKEGDRILDTHGGSRSLAIACHDYGFDHVSCELDLDYHTDSVKRFNNHILQTKLF